MRITKIEPQKKHPARKSVFIDGKFAFGIGGDLLASVGLRQGREVKQGEVDKFLRLEQEEMAKQKVLRFLSIRPRSKKEVRDYLRRKDYPEEIADKVVARFEELKMLDDLSFARMVCRDSLAKKPMGERLLRQVLHKKGVPKPAIDTVIPEFITSEAERTMAATSAARHYARLKRSRSSSDDAQTRKKLLDHLMRCGFGYDVALNAARTVLSKELAIRENTS